MFAGRLSDEKGVDTLVEAVAAEPALRARRRRRRPDARGARGARAEPRRGDRVRFHGRLPPTRPAGAAPRRGRRGRALALVREHAAGGARGVRVRACRWSATALGGIPELIEPGVDGRSCRRTTRRALAAALAGLRRRPGRGRSRWAGAARRRRSGEFAPEGHLERLDGLYAEAQRPGRGVRPLRIAMIGQRGVPATFGGIEHHVEELGARLVERGHEVTVYARTNYLETPIDEHRGMRRRRSCRPWTASTSTRSCTAACRPRSARCRERARRRSTTTRSGPGIPAALPRYRRPREGRPDRPRPRRRAGEVGPRRRGGALGRPSGCARASPTPRSSSRGPRRSTTATPTGGRTWYIPNGVEPQRPAAAGRDHRALGPDRGRLRPVRGAARPREGARPAARARSAASPGDRSWCSPAGRASPTTTSARCRRWPRRTTA